MYDLHVHTSASDGTLAPAQLVAMAKKIGLAGIAITDHDTIAGLPEGLEAGRLEKIKVIPGIELSCFWREEEVHLLGYFIDASSGPLLEKLASLQRQRKDRIKEMIGKANRHGFNLTLSDVEEFSQGEAIGRPHLAQALVKKGYLSSVQEGFTNFLTKGKPLYVPRAKLSPLEAVELICRAGGLPVLAHPGLYDFAWKPLIAELLPFGLAGLEVYYPQHDGHTTGQLLALAREYDLIATGGSDFHGEKLRENMLGAAGVEEKTMEQLEAKKVANITKLTDPEYNTSRLYSRRWKHGLFPKKLL